jgi:hypothetical protein
MGQLVAKRYSTSRFAKLADHTYVECGTGGKGWSCWGGKTGGAELRRGVGSTKRADGIAGSDGRGGITCYLVNGVCHQAANRILLPAGITVRGARGYEVSEALFGTYGRPGGVFGLCQAPFDQHAGSTGDIPECAAPYRLGEEASRCEGTETGHKPGGAQVPSRGARDLPEGPRAAQEREACEIVRGRTGSRGLSSRAIHAPGRFQATLAGRPNG